MNEQQLRGRATGSRLAPGEIALLSMDTTSLGGAGKSSANCVGSHP
ncbi:hypothetical protein ACFQ6H_08330 [Rhodococcus sp. NPDC056506]